jgi:4-carboxymuconolactone decarboxylase
MSELNGRERSLVALGAALASNCVPCVEYHIPGARKAGLDDIEIGEALRIADKVRRVPARTVLEAAEARLETAAKVSTETGGSGCGCGGSDSASEAGGVS